MLFKEILEQPEKGPRCLNKVTRNGKPQKKVLKKTVEKKSHAFAKPKGPVNKRGAGTRTVKVSKPTVVAKNRAGEMQAKTKYDANIPSSTPVFTPIKKDKLPHSVSSSQCSLIELLQQYNTSAFHKEDAKNDNEILDKTVTPEASIKTVHEETLLSPQLQTFREVLTKLLRTVDSNADIGSNAIKHAFEDVQVAFNSLPGTQPEVEHRTNTLAGGDNLTIVSNSSKLEELQIENLSLQRKLRLAKKEAETQANKSSSADISLELMTLQCQNKALEQKVSELTTAFEQALILQQSLVDTNTSLKHENEKLQSELRLKHDELAKSGDLFTFETREIKKDVGEALQKVELLKSTLDETGKLNHELTQQVQSKDIEITRLNELNKGLQGSVSRLLEDLKKASRPADAHIDMRSEMLKKVDTFLSSPQRQNTVTKHDSPPFNQYFSSQQRNVPNIVDALSLQYSIKNQSSKPLNFENSETVESAKSVLGSAATPSLPTTDSVSSSMWSITSRDERDFNAGLASLDADIQRLQSSLNALNT